MLTSCNNGMGMAEQGSYFNFVIDDTSSHYGLCNVIVINWADRGFRVMLYI